VKILNESLQKKINMSADIICYCCGKLFNGKSVTELKEPSLREGLLMIFQTRLTTFMNIILHSVIRAKEIFCD